ncbi:uncharacterized protein HGUI_02418 [Hanseniaspora guilliermondii]|uniref:V-SNARE coiled-coil homology domain-containing protein n=1 Tax=Hanseniaspora guilliermondii TaxID=56406 RepID=A0A1L0B1D2_9ASCO|nr:uncharacterized protein HGUI_02418 [Hanseniaspora guilliermondii]
MVTIPEYHILYYGIFDFHEQKIISLFNEKGKGNSQYGSIVDKTIKNTNFIETVIKNKIDLKSLFLNHDENIVVMNNILSDYLFFIKKNFIQNKRIYEICISKKSIPRSLSLSILNNKQKIAYTDLFDKSKELLRGNLQEFIESFETQYNEEASYTSDNIASIDQELNEILSVMNNNIDHVLIREDRLDHLQQKTLKLTDKGKKFKRTTKKTESRELWKNRKWKIITIFAVVVIILMIVTFEKIFSK